jgi:uncharacterized protein YqcC (DUF446 family)
MQVESMQEQTSRLRCKILLDELAQAMGRCHLWSQHRPSLAAFTSAAPFACDTMVFEQWLQFVFIPKMNLLIEQQQPLPVKIAILPMAEEVYKSVNNVDEVLITLARIDRLLGEPQA